MYVYLAIGLLGDDREWIETIIEAIPWASSSKLRRLFTTLIFFCEIGEPHKLLEMF